MEQTAAAMPETLLAQAEPNGETPADEQPPEEGMADDAMSEDAAVGEEAPLPDEAPQAEPPPDTETTSDDPPPPAADNVPAATNEAPAASATTTAASDVAATSTPPPIDPASSAPPAEAVVEVPVLTAGEGVPVDQLAQLEYDKGVFFFGVLPLIVIAVLALICGVLYFFRRSKNWNELGEAMRIDGGDTPIGASQTPSQFSTRELSEMEPTRPSQRVSEIKD